MSSFATHTVFNQVPPLEDYCLYATDPALREAVHGGAPAAQEQEQGMQPGLAQERGVAPGEAGGGAGGSGGAGGEVEVEVEPAPLEITIWLTRAGPG